jgi:hypothetical protein
MSALNKVMEYLGLVDGPVGATGTDEEKVTKKTVREVRPVSVVNSNQNAGVTVLGGGLAFGLQGGIERIASRVFLISPANVKVRTEDKAAFAQASFFNQS